MRFRPKPLDARLKRVLDSILAGDFGDHPDDFNPLVDAITNGHDYYLVSVDFASCTFPRFPPLFLFFLPVFVLFGRVSFSTQITCL